MREVLHEDDALTVAVVIDDETAHLVVESTQDGPDLSVPDEVVVVVDGAGCPLDIKGEHEVWATLVEELDEDPNSLTLMVRVYEFFEGWDLFADDGE